MHLASAWIAAGLASSSSVARAVDPFEIQVYDGTADAAHAAGLELHVNRVFSGPKTARLPELPAHHRTTFTLEPSYGVCDFWELGAYLQTALRASGEFDYAGMKLRSKFVTPPTWDAHLRFGANFEISVLPRQYDRDRYGGELRPIAAWEDEHWLFAANPILDFAFKGSDARQGPAFEPSAMAKRKFGGVAVGLEYYSGLGPLAHPLPWSEQIQYLYESADLISLHRVELNFGIGEGLTSASNALVAKLILGYALDPPTPKPATPEMFSPR